ncbi:MAG TPA: hypothetical protein VJC12_02240 [Candidatus Paceibacterota bacterium]
MTFIEKIDSVVLKLFTKIAHAFQRLTGKTNYFLAKIGTTMVALNVGLDAVNYFYRIFPGRKTSGFMFTVSVVVLIGLFLDTMKLDNAERQHKDSEVKVAIKFIFPNSPVWRVFLLMFAYLSTVVLISIIRHGFDQSLLHTSVAPLFSYGLLFFCYFRVVEPLHPQKGKIKEWLEKFSLSPKPATAKSPTN